MKIFYLITLSITLFINPLQAYGTCPSKAAKNFGEFNLISENFLPDQSRQLVWKAKEKVVSLVQFKYPSNNVSQLKILTNSVASQLAKAAQNTQLKTIKNPKENIDQRLFQLVFISSHKSINRYEIAGIFSDPTCTEVIRITDINSASPNESLVVAADTMRQILALRW